MYGEFFPDEEEIEIYEQLVNKNDSQEKVIKKLFHAHYADYREKIMRECNLIDEEEADNLIEKAMASTQAETIQDFLIEIRELNNRPYYRLLTKNS